ncbi:hypothetical protein ACRE_067470 [Hapsidospora chrysogenum ATCC 11550]|uniref:Peroxisomal membrane protein-like protein n=1 Tax=Hapsidospora chrysogenum (strain ATCC 11550 / CBS 779.69 / DSM 880 / IAM 14645 / JCM 23072 / IMI 49137) TaxID=857340 RepID=A0A086SZH1_HAPC1|nr:hypothetical protein ACRE_067470 [Hapsidospora chrysogenum ATCC 11550]
MAHPAAPRRAAVAPLPKQLANFTNSTDGLDLTLRLIQAVTVVAAHLLVVDNVAVERCWIAVSQLALARRYLRFFCFLDCFYKAHGLVTGSSTSGAPSLLKMMEIFESTCLGLYFVTENMTMLHDMDIWLVPWYTPVLMEANKLWLYAIVLSIARTMWKLLSSGGQSVAPTGSSNSTSQETGASNNNNNNGGEKREEEEEEKEAPSSPESAPSTVRLLRRLVVDSCDLTLPASFLGWVPLGDFGVGVAMVVSSLLAWPDLWAATQRH